MPHIYHDIPRGTEDIPPPPPPPPPHGTEHTFYTMYNKGGFFYMEQLSVPWTNVHSVRLCNTTKANTFLSPSLIHFPACQYPINFTYRKSADVPQISKMAGDQNIALMLVQVLIQHISDMENEFVAWLHVYVFFLHDVIEIGQVMGYFEKQAIPRINGYFDITVSMHSDS